LEKIRSQAIETLFSRLATFPHPVREFSQGLGL
jgi:hypothetical protein